MGKDEFSKAFHEVITLITGFFPHLKPSSASPSDDLYPWLDVFGTSLRRNPRLFLTLFEKLSALSKEIDEKFRKAADDKKSSSDDFFKAPKINESFSCLLSKPVSTSRYVSISLVDSAKLEACIHGQLESQSIGIHITCPSDNPYSNSPLHSCTTFFPLH